MLTIQRLKAAPGIWVFSLKGSVDSSNVAELQEAFETAFKNSIYRLVIDLACVEFVASSGFGCFLTSRDQANENGGDLVFSGARIQVREIFNLMGLDTLLKFFRDVPSALEHISKQTQTTGRSVPRD